MADPTMQTRDGRSSIKILLIRLQPKVLIKNLDSKSTDHSTLFQTCQCTELLNVLELTTWLLRDTPREDLDNNSTSMEFQELSDLNNGRTMPWKSNPMVEAPTLDSPLASILDGGNSSKRKVHSLSMREERFWMSQVDLMMKTETFKSSTNTERSTNNGKLSMLINTQTSQSRESLTQISVCMLRETSMLYQNLRATDISISSTTETWSSRLQMEERLKCGTSINSH
jgi:hypothetical protein